MAQLDIFAPGNKSVRKEIVSGGLVRTLARAAATFPCAPGFSDGQIIDLLKEMRRLARRALIVLDLERHPVPGRGMVQTEGLTILAKTVGLESTPRLSHIRMIGENKFMEALVACTWHAHYQERKRFGKVLALNGTSDTHGAVLLLRPNVELPRLIRDTISIRAAVLTVKSKLQQPLQAAQLEPKVRRGVEEFNQFSRTDQGILQRLGHTF